MCEALRPYNFMALPIRPMPGQVPDRRNGVLRTIYGGYFIEDTQRMKDLQAETPVSKNFHPLDGLPMHRSIPLPAHMVPPGQDGYRTPIVEDYQQPVREGPRRLRLSNRGSRPNRSWTSLDKGIAGGLEWKERIRHYTWTFFTITMATGGIANVIYSGDDWYTLLQLYR